MMARVHHLADAAMMAASAGDSNISAVDQRKIDELPDRLRAAVVRALAAIDRHEKTSACPLRVGP
jgi:hypothetical protein